MADFAIPTCPHCGHELKGRPLRGTCPACQEEYSLNLPGLGPGAVPRSTRFQRLAEYDLELSRRSFLRSVILTIVSVSIITFWKAAQAEEGGAQQAGNFLFRYGLTLAAAVGVYIIACTIHIIEYCGPLIRACFGVASALAGALLTQHISAELLNAIGAPVLGLPWVFSLIVFLGLAADSLDLDITEAAMLSIFVLFARLMLKFTVFDHM